ncbi:MAG TPA: ABC transporter permease [Candidatus Acidoferrum sp.]|nr:ABC transporter permease [Candidatus Acidoferrum sp.]
MVDRFLQSFQRLFSFFRRAQLDRDLDAEIASHVQLATEENLQRGLSPDEARRQALVRLGGPQQAKEQHREARSLPFLETLLQDLRFAFRVLRKSPSFTAIAVLTLALGIGASTAIFSVVDAVLLRPLPYPNPQQIVTLWEQEIKGHRAHLADPNFLDFREQNHTLAGLAVVFSGPESISGGSEPVRTNIALVSQDFFKVMGVGPAQGRAFASDELRPHGTPAMIVSHGYWQQYLGSRGDFSNVRLNTGGQVYSVVGVMPQGFDFPAGVSAWLPREQLDEWSTSRTSHNGEGIGRLRNGFSLEQARADMSTIARRIKSLYGKEGDINSGYMLVDAAVVPLADTLVGNVRAALLTLFAAVILLFVVACANVAGLLLARTATRRKELAVRAALGAGRGRLVQQLLAESLALALAGGALGTLAAIWTTRLLPAILPANLPRQQGIAINGTVLVFTLIATLIVAFGLGLFAAWRCGGLDLNEALGSGSRSYSAGSQKARSALVTGEIAVTLMLLLGAGLLGRSFLRLISVNPGVNGEHLILATFQPIRLPTSDASFRQVQLIDNILSRLRAIPGVQSAGFTGGLPIASGFADGQFLILNGLRPPASFEEWGSFTQNPRNVGVALYCPTSSDYFRTAGIPLRRGRLFDERDGPDSLHVAVISETLAREQWTNQDPLGQVIEFGNMDGNLKPLAIVGIVGDVRADGLDRPVSPMIYVDYVQRGLSGNSLPMILVRTDAVTGAVVNAARGIFHDLAPDVPVKFSTFADEMGGWLSEKRFLLLLAGVFAAAALALAAVGIYGLIAHSVSQRTQEIGIRMSLGAERRNILRLVLGEGARMAAFGLIIGIGASLAITRLMSSLLFGISASDPLTFVAVAALLAAVALLASYIPARRAMRVDPMVALRYE